MSHFTQENRKAINGAAKSKPAKSAMTIFPVCKTLKKALAEFFKADFYHST